MSASPPTSEPIGVADPSGPTGTLAVWASGLQLPDVPESTRERAVHLLLDGVACALVGAQLPWSRTAADAVLGIEASGPGTVIGWGRSTSVTSAALLNGTFVQAFELDDYHALVPVHSEALVLPAVLAAAQHRGGATGAEALVAAVAGFEVAPRIGLALGGLDMLSRGWHSGAVFGTIAAAAVAGRLLRLTPAAMEDAFGLAATQSAGLMAAQFEAMVKRMHHGLASRNGVFAAIMAAGGYTGIKRVLERGYGGYVQTFSAGGGHHDAGLASQGLGEDWQLERVAIKPYATMAGLHPAIDAIFALRARHAFGPEDVEQIDVEVGEAVYHHGGWTLERPAEVVGAQMNLAYAVAVALLDGEVTVRQFTPERIDGDDVWRIIDRVAVRQRPDDTGLAADERLSTSVAVLLHDGTRLEDRVVSARGGLSRPFSNADIVEKYRSLVAGVVSPARASAIERLVLGLESLDDVGVLADALSPRVGELLA
jgi:2-methylcitrate dehydratase PrpD